MYLRKRSYIKIAQRQPVAASSKTELFFIIKLITFGKRIPQV
jgi:hypothetical protein